MHVRAHIRLVGVQACRLSGEASAVYRGTLSLVSPTKSDPRSIRPTEGHSERLARGVVRVAMPEKDQGHMDEAVPDGFPASRPRERCAHVAALRS